MWLIIWWFDKGRYRLAFKLAILLIYIRAVPKSANLCLNTIYRHKLNIDAIRTQTTKPKSKSCLTFGKQGTLLKISAVQLDHRWSKD